MYLPQVFWTKRGGGTTWGEEHGRSPRWALCVCPKWSLRYLNFHNPPRFNHTTGFVASLLFGSNWPNSTGSPFEVALNLPDLAWGGGGDMVTPRPEIRTQTTPRPNIVVSFSCFCDRNQSPVLTISYLFKVEIRSLKLKMKFFPSKCNNIFNFFQICFA